MASARQEDAPEVSFERFQSGKLGAQSEMAIWTDQAEARPIGAEAGVERPRRVKEQLVWNVCTRPAVAGHDVGLHMRPVASGGGARQSEPVVDPGRIRFAEHEEERVTGRADQLVQAAGAVPPFERCGIADPEADLRAAGRGSRIGHDLIDDRAPFIAEADFRLGDGGQPAALRVGQKRDQGLPRGRVAVRGAGFGVVA